MPPPRTPASRPVRPGRTPSGPAREHQLLDVTLEVLAEAGYAGLSLDVVAARAQASKATLYRRWPSKAELVVAAFARASGPPPASPDTGSLAGDLSVLIEQVAAEASRHGGLMVGLFYEMHRNPDLARAFEERFLAPRWQVVRGVLERAAGRGELAAEAPDPELLWDLVVGLLLYRAAAPGRAVTADTVGQLVDEVLVPLARAAPRRSEPEG